MIAGCFSQMITPASPMIMPSSRAPVYGRSPLNQRCPSVAIPPLGERALTAMLCWYNSLARPCVNRSMWALPEPYAVPSGRDDSYGPSPGPMAPTELMLMMWP